MGSSVFGQYVFGIVAYVAVGLLLVILAYGIGRAFGVGFYRSKMEHVRRFLREINGGRP